MCGKVSLKMWGNSTSAIINCDIEASHLQTPHLTPFLDENLLTERCGKRYWFTHDGLGSVRQLFDDFSRIKNSYAYTAWGMPLNWHESIPNRYTFTGREWNSESSLHCYRARYYQPNNTRFTSSDLIVDEYDYVYADNCPIIITDPFGLNNENEEQMRKLEDERKNINKAIKVTIKRKMLKPGTTVIIWSVEFKMTIPRNLQGRGFVQKGWVTFDVEVKNARTQRRARKKYHSGVFVEEEPAFRSVFLKATPREKSVEFSDSPRGSLIVKQPWCFEHVRISYAFYTYWVKIEGMFPDKWRNIGFVRWGFEYIIQNGKLVGGDLEFAEKQLQPIIYSEDKGIQQLKGNEKRTRKVIDEIKKFQRELWFLQ